MATILCVEDEEILRQCITDELTEAGHRVLQAGDGQQGFEMAVEHTPDLIISDITMPRISGFALLEALRKKDSKLADIPFIFLSALADRNDVLDGIKLGADDYITKPVDLDMMLTKVSAILRQANRFLEQKQKEKEKFVKVANSVIKQKEQENVKLTAALRKTMQQTQQVVDGTDSNFIVPRAKTPGNIVLVGRGDKVLFSFRELLSKTGHNVTVFTSGRTYLESPHKHTAMLTLIWLQSDDLTAQKIMNMHHDKKGKFVLIVPKQLASESAKSAAKIFDGSIYLPVTPEKLFEHLSPMI